MKDEKVLYYVIIIIFYSLLRQLNVKRCTWIEMDVRSTIEGDNSAYLFHSLYSIHQILCGLNFRIVSLSATRFVLDVISLALRLPSGCQSTSVGRTLGKI